MSNGYPDYNERKRRMAHRRTVRNITALVLMTLIVIGLMVFRIFVLPRMEIADMDYIELLRENGEPYRIALNADNCSYSVDGILKWWPVDGVLVMKNGETQPVLYDGNYGVFMISDKYRGCYVIDEK